MLLLLFRKTQSISFAGSSMCSKYLSHSAPKVRNSASTASLAEEGLRANKTLPLPF